MLELYLWEIFIFLLSIRYFLKFVLNKYNDLDSCIHFGILFQHFAPKYFTEICFIIYHYIIGVTNKTKITTQQYFVTYFYGYPNMFIFIKLSFSILDGVWSHWENNRAHWASEIQHGMVSKNANMIKIMVILYFYKYPFR